MATSGINTKDYTVDYLIRRASKLAGGEPMSGTDAEDAMDMLNELLISMSNDEHPLSRIKTKTVAVSASVASVDAGSSIAAVYDGVLTRSSIDYALNRIGRLDYLNIPTKESEGKPSQFMVDQSRSSVTLFFWPLADQNDTFTFRGAVRPQIVTRLQQTLDLHDRYIPAVIMGLAYKMSFERRGIDSEYRMQLKQEYEQLLMSAQEEDRERVDWRLYVA